MSNKSDQETNLRDKAYKLMREVRLIAENFGCEVTENDFSLLDKIDEIYYESQSDNDLDE